jgi:hypothetical protein
VKTVGLELGILQCLKRLHLPATALGGWGRAVWLQARSQSPDIAHIERASPGFVPISPGLFLVGI